MAALKLFGKYDGKPIYLIKLANGEIEAEFISFGATLRSLKVKDKNGDMCDVCLGYDSVEEYATNDGYIGATVGRNANRIGGSCVCINGKEFELCANEGENQLHGGINAFSHRLWGFTCEENAVTFSINSPDGDEGYPGNFHADVRFSINGSSLRIEYSAKCDTDTICNMTNHAYFNLGGHASGDIYKHTLCLGAESYTPCGDGNIPTGDIAPVVGTALDFIQEIPLAPAILSFNGSATEGLDHNFCLNASPAAQLYCPESGIEMQCTTSLEGLQVYSGGFLSSRRGKDGAIYEKHNGICLETQHYPDAPNHLSFPSTILKAGEEYKEWTEYKFRIR